MYEGIHISCRTSYVITVLKSGSELSASDDGSLVWNLEQCGSEPLRDAENIKRKADCFAFDPRSNALIEREREKKTDNTNCNNNRLLLEQQSLYVLLKVARVTQVVHQWRELRLHTEEQKKYNLISKTSSGNYCN